MTETSLDTSTETLNLAETETTATETTTSDWKQQIPEEYRGQFETYKDLAAAAKAHVELRRMTSKKIADLTPDEAKALLGRTGVPESPDKYDIGEDKIAQDPTLAKWFTSTAHKAGVPQDAVKIFAEEYVAFAESQQRELLTRLEELKKSNHEQLKQDWGAVYDERLKLSDEGIDKLGIPDLRKTLEDTHMLHSAPLRKAFAEIGRLLSEDRGPETKNNKFALSAEEAKSDLVKFRNEYKNELLNSSHPQHRWAVEELERRLLRAHS